MKEAEAYRVEHDGLSSVSLDKANVLHATNAPRKHCIPSPLLLTIIPAPPLHGTTLASRRVSQSYTADSHARTQPRRSIDITVVALLKHPHGEEHHRRVQQHFTARNLTRTRGPLSLILQPCRESGGGGGYITKRTHSSCSIESPQYHKVDMPHAPYASPPLTKTNRNGKKTPWPNPRHHMATPIALHRRFISTRKKASPKRQLGQWPPSRRRACGRCA